MTTAAILQNVRPHMEVLCSLGVHIGTVDDVEGEYLKLTRNDSTDGKHHFIDGTLVALVDEKVHLAHACDEVMRTWGTEP
jgi:hypothetical protein